MCDAVQYLDLCENPFEGPLLPAGAPLLGRLSALALPAAVASANRSLLPCLTSLTALELHVWVVMGAAGIKWERLLAAVAGIASLRSLCIDDHVLGRSAEAHAAVAMFATARPAVSLVEYYFPQPPGLQPHTWYPKELDFRLSQRQ